MPTAGKNWRNSMRIRQRTPGHHQEAHPEREYRHWFDFRPRYVWEFPNKGQPALVLFEVDNTGPHPGSTGVRINVFEKAKNVRSESVFWTGHRCYMHAVSLDKQADDQDPLIVLETGLGPGPGPNVQKQIYARVGNRFDLIRLEDSEGKATRNNYYVNHFACGLKCQSRPRRSGKRRVVRRSDQSFSAR